MAFDLFQKVTARLQNRNIDQSADMPDVPKDVRTFLGQLGILQHIPIYYLIPDEKYLPKTEGNEGGVLRLFRLDKEWIECLIDGALSIGEEEDRQLLLAKAMAGNYVAEVYYEDTKEQIKKQLKGSYSPKEFDLQFEARLKLKNITFRDGRPLPTVAQNNWCYTGFLMRSALISAWIGVEVIAKGDDPNTENAAVRPLQVVRLERLSPDTLFCLCEGIIRQVEIVQPPEAFHFRLRKEGNDPCKAGNTVVQFKSTPGVLNIKQLQTDLAVADAAELAVKMASKPVKVYMDINWTKAK